MRLNDQLRASRIQCEEQRIKLEEAGAKKSIAGGTYQSNASNNRPLTAGPNSVSFNNQLNNNGSMIELQEKDDKIKELN